MTPATAIILSLILSIVLIVFGLGLRTTMEEALWLFRRPLQLFKALLAIYVVVPAFAIGLCLAFDLSAPVKFALVALAVSPLPPILPMKQEKLGGEHSYVVSLLVCASLFALVLTPLLLSVAGRVLDVAVSIPPAAVARSLLISVAAPLVAGMLLRALAPRAAGAIEAYASRAGKLLLVVGFLVLLASQWRGMVSLLGNGTIIAIAATVVVGLVAGHLLASGKPGERSALAVAAATRHPGVAIAIAGANFADQKQIAIAAVLLFLVVNAVVSIPYVRWINGQPAVPQPA
jgi:BASS family bile acid:Na+ symporter